MKTAMSWSATAAGDVSCSEIGFIFTPRPFNVSLRRPSRDSILENALAVPVWEP